MKIYLNHHSFFLVICVHLISMKLISTAPAVEENNSFRSYVQRMKSFMNTSVEPCDDFYSFACGNYPNVIEDLEARFRRKNLIDVLFILFDRFDDILRKDRDPTEKFYDELKIAREFVSVCESAELSPMEASEEYLKVIKTMGGFPALDETWDKNSFDWFNMTAHLLRYNIVGLVEEKIVPIHPYTPLYKLPKLGFGFDVYQENIATNNSEGYVYNENEMRNLLEIYNVSDQKADEVIEGIFNLWNEILELKSQIKNEQNPFKDCQELTRNTNGLQSFEKWNNIFKIAWDTSKLNNSLESPCPCSWFYNHLDSLAQKRPEDFANYMALKFLFRLHPRWKSAKFQRRKCIETVKHAMPLLFSYFYIKEHYNKEDEKDIINIIGNLKLSWKYRINATEWLDDKSRNEAFKKLYKIVSKIGKIGDPISEVYIKQIKNLRPTESVDLNNLQLAKFHTDMTHYGFLHSDEISRQSAAYSLLNAASVRAFYFHPTNVFILMGGILHPPAYHKDFSLAIKYGSLGYIMGHELGHGFEGSGFLFNSLEEHKLWLSEESSKIAENRSECFVEDYQNYKDPFFNQTLNGKMSLDEIQADSLGLREAFETYRRVVNDSKINDDSGEENILGLSLSQEQVFFISFAQLFCAKYRRQDYWHFKSLRHPLDRYRVMGTLRNFEEFSEVFNCPSGSAMNPSKKCRLW